MQGLSGECNLARTQKNHQLPHGRAAVENETLDSKPTKHGALKMLIQNKKKR